MKTDEFDRGDIIIRIGEETKWVVDWTDSFSYFLKSLSQLKNGVTASTFRYNKKDIVNHCVKVGSWNFSLRKEEVDDGEAEAEAEAET